MGKAELLGRAARRLHRWLRRHFEEVRNDLPAHRIVSDDLPEGHKRVWVPVMTPSGFSRVLVQGHGEAFDQYFQDFEDARQRDSDDLDRSLRRVLGPTKLEVVHVAKREEIRIDGAHTHDEVPHVDGD